MASKLCAMPMRDLVWLFENVVSPFGMLLATNHNLHQVGTCIVFWPVTQKPLDELNILTKKGKQNVSIATLIVP